MEADQNQELLRKCFSGNASEQEWMLLKLALEKPENVVLREELVRLGKLTTEHLVVNDVKMWGEISHSRDAGHNRLSFQQRLIRYAAILILPLLVGGILIGIQHLNEESVVVPISALAPGQSRAILKLETGEQIDLATVGQDTSFTHQGVTIRLDSSKVVSYQSAGSKSSSDVYNVIYVPRGGEYQLVLADGSVVWLNSDSELRFPIAFTGTQRKVFLKGEAYFEVVKNPTQPFMVEVTGMEVKVLGTQFNINAYREDGEVQTTLVQGKVEVADSEHTKSVILQPDQQALLKNGHLSVREADATVYTAWREGKFYFESEPLSEIAAQLERWYNVEFFFSREELKDYEFTGVIRRDYTAQRMLDIIAKTTNVRFEVKGKVITAF